MKRSWIYVLLAVIAVGGVALVACGGGGSKSNNAAPTTAPQQQGSTPAAQATTAKQPTSASSGSSGGSAGSLNDVPVYPGATKVTSGEFSGSSASIPAIGSNLNAADYKNVAYGVYETDDSPQTVFDWYKNHMSGWTDEGSFSGGSGGESGAFAAWSKDSGKEAAWITVGSSEGKTSLSIWVGTP